MNYHWASPCSIVESIPFQDFHQHRQSYLQSDLQEQMSERIFKDAGAVSTGRNDYAHWP